MEFKLSTNSWNSARAQDLPPIRDVTLFPVRTPRLYGEPSSHILVRLRAADGTAGWGEMSDVSHLPAMMPEPRDLERCLQVLLEGRSPLELNVIDDLMVTNFPGTRFHGKACLVRAGVSIAVHDLAARLLGVPMHVLLGGARRERIAICYPIFRMRGREDVADRKELVRRQFDAGFSQFRLYFGHDGDADTELLESICGTYGSRIRLTSLDGSGLFSLPAFLRAYRRLARFPFESIESPVYRDDVPLIAEARREIDHPVSEHVRSEEYAMRLVRERAVDIFNVSITVAGGLRGMLRLFAIADAASLEILIGTTQELSIATAAQAHAGAVAPHLDYASDPVGPSLYQGDVTHQPVRFEDGHLLVPDGCGHGIVVDESLVERLGAPLSSVNDVTTGFSRG